MTNKLVNISGPYPNMMLRYKGMDINFVGGKAKVSESVAAFLITRPGYSLLSDEHTETKIEYKKEEKEYTSDIPSTYVPITTDKPVQDPAVKLVAYYLPQFHAIPENNLWWGEGFTEWTNVKSAKPLFEGHIQPAIPGELGYYNLLDSKVQERQIELAKLYGIGGFCFYFYWFSGRRLLEQPTQNFLDNKSLNFPFCLCWANESWTRRWDGYAGVRGEMLIEQSYSPEDDIDFITYVSKYLKDPRYIRIDGKPLLQVYKPYRLPDPSGTTNRWREWCRDNGIGEIYLVCTQSYEKDPPEHYGFDAAAEFLPGCIDLIPVTEGIVPIEDIKDTRICDWDSVRSQREQHVESIQYKLFRSIFPSWDNTSRRKLQGVVFVNDSLKRYEEWLKSLIVYTKGKFSNKDERLVFINAWNEWAEGAYLEPDKTYGYARLQATRNALECFSDKNTICTTLDQAREDAVDSRLILFDMLFCQGGYHGGGEYGKSIFKALCTYIYSQNIKNCKIYVAMNRDMSIDPWISDLCRQYGINIMDVKSYGDISELVNKDIFSAFFAPALVVYTQGYAYLTRAGSGLPFTQKKTRVIGGLHDIRDYELLEKLSDIIDSNISVNPQISNIGIEDFKIMYNNILASENIDSITTCSEYSKKSMRTKITKKTTASVHVFYPPMKERLVITKGAIELPTKFILLLCGHRFEKNSISAVRSLEELFTDGYLRDYSVVITGINDIDTLGTAVQCREKYLALGHVLPSNLEYVYSKAAILVYPSLGEGFGYPPLEIMQYGKTSVVSNITCLPEVYGDSVIYCDPYSISSIKKAVLRAINHPVSPRKLQDKSQEIFNRQKHDLQALVELIITKATNKH